MLSQHISVIGYAAPTQSEDHTPLTHFCSPYLHIPLSLSPHCLVSPSLQTPHPSSISPLQLSSRLFQHISAAIGLISPSQPPHMPLAHFCMPYSHMPLSVPPHCLICPGVHIQQSLSIIPSQSLSILSQYSC